MCTGTHPFIPIPTGAKAEVRSVYDGQQVESVFWFAKNTVYTVDDLNALADIIGTWYIDQFLPRVVASVEGAEIILTDWSEVAGLQINNVAIAGQSGSHSGNALPNNCALAVHFGTNVRGRSYQGRVYHFGLSENTVLNNTMNDAEVLAIEECYQALVDATTVVEDSQHMVIASFCGHGTWRLEGEATPITSVAVRDHVLDSQRRRLPGRGR